MQSAQRHALDAAAGLLSFDDLAGFRPRRLRVLWVENSLDCRTWAYYCDLRASMALLHDVCTPWRGGRNCLGDRGRKGKAWVPDVAVIGPRYAINTNFADEAVGFDRAAHARLPLLVVQNKMYVPSGYREIVGNRTAKLEWVSAAGAVAAFTWLTQHREFTALSGVPHHWLPFGVDGARFGRYRGITDVGSQPFDVGFTGASGSDKYPLRSQVLDAIRSMNVKAYLGTWKQTALNRADNASWQAGTHDEYARNIARSRMWVSTTGPSQLVGTRYFEVLASGTTLLLCNRPQRGEWVYDGLFEDGEHVVMFDDVSDLTVKITRILRNETERLRIVKNAHGRAHQLHTWDMRARFITKVAEEAIRQTPNRSPYYTSPSSLSRASLDVVHVGCFAPPKGTRLLDPTASRNKRKLYRYTVRSCQRACAGADFGLQGGGFVTGNGHAWGKCVCVERGADRTWQRRPSHTCTSSCNLHDSRPCGGKSTFALYAWRTLANGQHGHEEKSVHARSEDRTSGSISRRLQL